jgi:DNA-binding CsgD family transcriptional regulator
MSSKKDIPSTKTIKLKVLSANIIDSIRNDQGKNLPTIIIAIRDTSEGAQQLKDAIMEFAETYIQRRTFSPEEMKSRIERQCSVFTKHKFYELKARAKLLLASHYLATFRYFAECLKELIAVELIAQKHLGTNHMILCEALFTKGSVYYFQGDIESSSKAIEQAQSLQSFANANHELQYKSHINLARNYSMMNNLGKLKVHVELAEKSWEFYQSVYDKGGIYIRKSDIFRYENDWEGSYQILNEGLEFYKSTDFTLRTAEFYKEIGVVLSSDQNPNRDFNKAMDSLEQALNLSRQLKIERMEAAILQDMWEAAYKFEEWKVCSERLIEHRTIMDSINQEELNVHIKKLEQYEHEEKLKLMSEGKPSYNKGMIDEVLNLRKDTEVLRKKNTHYQNILSDLDSLIEKISHSNKIGQGTLQELSRILEKGKRYISTLDAKLAECEDAYPNFSASLVKLIPSITPMEMKVAKLIRIGLNTQAIATVCGVANKSIENHRINLRKKINLDHQQSLSAFIMTII